jgi:hypothetical protein
MVNATALWTEQLIKMTSTKGTDTSEHINSSTDLKNTLFSDSKECQLNLDI